MNVQIPLNPQSLKKWPSTPCEVCIGEAGDFTLQDQHIVPLISPDHYANNWG